MKAWQVQQFGAPRDALRLVEIDQPIPGPGEMRVRVAAVAIGMPDVFMCGGTYPLTPPLPFVPGQEACGVVDAVGEGVSLPIGARVMGVTNFTDGRGGFAEAVIMRADQAYPAPDWMSAADAASFRIGCSTAWAGIVRRGKLQPGEWLVVLGAAGGSGAAAVQLGCAIGARVIAVASGSEKLAFCERLGAEVLIDRATTKSLSGAIQTATKGRGADAVYDPVGGSLASAAMRGLAPNGRILAVGFASGEWLQVNVAALVWNSCTVMGVIPHVGSPELHAAEHEAMLALAARGRLGGYATTLPFNELPLAVEAVATRKSIGKLVVEVNT